MKTEFFFILGLVFLLYLTSLPLSITGMEVFGWLSILGAIGLVVFSKISGADATTGDETTPNNSTQKDCNLVEKTHLNVFNISLKLCLFALPFVLVALLGAVFIPDLGFEQRIYISGQMRWFFFLLMLPLLFSLYWSKHKEFFRFFIILVGLVGLYSIIQVFTGIDIFRSEPYTQSKLETLWRAKGFLGIMAYSYSLSMVFLFLYCALLMEWEEGLWRKILWASTFILGISLLLTFTRGMWISLSISILLVTAFISIKKISIALGAISLLFVTLIFSLPDFAERISKLFNKTDMRFKIWEAHWEIFKDNPWTGVGFEQGSQHLEKYYSMLNIDHEALITHAHNNYLSVLSGMGLFGLLAYMIFILGFLFISYQTWQKRNLLAPFEKIACLGSLGAMVSFHIGGLTECNYLDAEVFHAYIVVLSLTIFLWSKVKFSEEPNVKF